MHLFLGKIRFGRDNISISIKPRIDIFKSLFLFSFLFLFPFVPFGIIGYSVWRRKEFLLSRHRIWSIENDQYKMIYTKYTGTFFRYRTDPSIYNICKMINTKSTDTFLPIPCISLLRACVYMSIYLRVKGKFVCYI